MMGSGRHGRHPFGRAPLMHNLMAIRASRCMHTSRMACRVVRPACVSHARGRGCTHARCMADQRANLERTGFVDAARAAPGQPRPGGAHSDCTQIQCNCSEFTYTDGMCLVHCNPLLHSCLMIGWVERRVSCTVLFRLSVIHSVLLASSSSSRRRRASKPSRWRPPPAPGAVVNVIGACTSPAEPGTRSSS